MYLGLQNDLGYIHTDLSKYWERWRNTKVMRLGDHGSTYSTNNVWWEGREERELNQEFWLHLCELRHVCPRGHLQGGEASSFLPFLFISCDMHKYTLTPKKTFNQFLMFRTNLKRNSELRGPWELREAWRTTLSKIEREFKFELDDILEICFQFLLI